MGSAKSKSTVSDSQCVLSNGSCDAPSGFDDDSCARYGGAWCAGQAVPHLAGAAREAAGATLAAALGRPRAAEQPATHHHHHHQQQHQHSYALFRALFGGDPVR